MGLKDMADKAKDALEDVRDTAGDLAEKAVDKIDDATGGKVPDAVKDIVDKIDGDDEIADKA